MSPPRVPELVAFTALCALLLFAPATPLVVQVARFASSKGLSPSETASLLVASVFACLALVATLIAVGSAGLRKLAG